MIDADGGKKASSFRGSYVQVLIAALGDRIAGGAAVATTGGLCASVPCLVEAHSIEQCSASCSQSRWLRPRGMRFQTSRSHFVVGRGRCLRFEFGACLPLSDLSVARHTVFPRACAACRALGAEPHLSLLVMPAFSHEVCRCHAFVQSRADAVPGSTDGVEPHVVVAVAVMDCRRATVTLSTTPPR